MKKLRYFILLLALSAIVFGVWFFGFRNRDSSVNNGIVNIDREIVSNTESDSDEVPDVTNDVDVEETDEDSEDDEDSPLPVTSIDNAIPFTAQAATGEWSDDRQQDACEEASAIMAIWWARDQKPLSAVDARDRILAVVNYEEKMYGGFHDTNADDTVARIFKDFFEFENAVVKKDIVIGDIIQELMKGNVVIVPADGQVLGNPNFTAPGPERHMLLIRGYDAEKKEFITNDPGTRRGEAYRYKQDVLFGAIREYPTGYHEKIVGRKKVMIVVSR